MTARKSVCILCLWCSRRVCFCFGGIRGYLQMDDLPQAEGVLLHALYLPEPRIRLAVRGVPKGALHTHST